MPVSNQRWIAIAIALLAAGSFQARGAAEAESKALCLEIATLFRAARAVISSNQDVINSPASGKSELLPENVVNMTKANYEKAASRSFPAIADDSLAGQARRAMIEAVTEVMTQAQPLVNDEGKGFKGFLPAVFAKLVADDFSDRMSGRMAIKLTAPKSYVRNRANRPDSWENSVIETRFKAANWNAGQEFSESSTHKGKPGFRLLLPEYYGQSCLDCHGDPKGERDITGGLKEGGQLGELGGAISVVVYD